MTPSELIKELGKGKFRPVYYYYGSEEFRIKEAEKETVRRFLPPSLIKTNHTTLSASKSKPEDIMAELSVFPMLGERQAFTISEAQALSQKQLESILKLLTPADPTRIVILSSSANKAPGKKTKLFKFMTAETAAVEFGKLSKGSSSKRLKAIFEKNNVNIDNEALENLTTLADGALGAIMLEADKLVDYVGEGGTVTAKEIAEVSSDYQGFIIYELADYVAARKVDRALEIIEFLNRSGESPSGILYFVAEHFVDLYLVKNRKSPGPTRKYLAWKYDKQVNLFSNQQLEKIIHLIALADRELRDVTGDKKTVIEKLVLEIAGMEN